MPQKLSTVIALDSQARQEANKAGGRLHKESQKSALFNGFAKDYRPFGETDAEHDLSRQLPSEGARVQLVAETVLREFLDGLRQPIDLAATKDEANRHAVADVVVDGEILFSAVPAPHLLHMGHVLDDIATFIAKLPVLDPSVRWSDEPDRHTGLYSTEPTFTNRTEPKQVALTLLAPTKEHPGQAIPVQEMVATGRWTTVRFSGALTPERKQQLEERVSLLKMAFKAAREEANRIEAPEVREAQFIVNYLLG